MSLFVSTRQLVAIALVMGVARPLLAQVSEDRRAFDDPSALGHLAIHAPKATILVRGEDRSDVHASLRFLESADVDVPRVGSIPLLTGGGQEMRIDLSWNTSEDVALEVRVPRRMSVQVEGRSGGTITVREVHGEIEITGVNGDLELINVAGSAMVNTTNGDIRASFTGVTGGRPMSFITSNGRIDVSFPSTVRAEILMETTDAQFFSDFTIEPSRDREAVGVGSRMRGKIGGGGPLFRFKTHSEPIVLRRTPSG